MKRHISIVIALIFLNGCAQNMTPSPVVVTPGLGIANVVELGMTIEDIRGNVRGEQVVSEPPGASPSFVYLKVPPLGAVIGEKSNTAPIEHIVFFCNRTNPVEFYSDIIFVGSLSCGLSFSSNKSVPRSSVIEHFGEPKHSVTYPHKNESEQELDVYYSTLEELQNQEESFSQVGLGSVETIHYPTNGIEFDVSDGVVRSFTVKNAVEQ